MIEVMIKRGMRDGFYAFHGGKRRYPGDKFLVEESQFSERYMEKVNKPGPKPKDKGGE